MNSVKEIQQQNKKYIYKEAIVEYIIALLDRYTQGYNRNVSEKEYERYRNTYTMFENIANDIIENDHEKNIKFLSSYPQLDKMWKQI